MDLLTRSVLRHKVVVVVAWLVVAAVGFMSLPSLKSHLDKTFKLPGHEGFDTSNRSSRSTATAASFRRRCR